MCSLFAKLRYCVNFNLLKIVYDALVGSHLNYCNLAWGNANSSTLKQLQILQNRIIRTMTFAPFNCQNVSHIFDDLEVLNLEQIHKLNKAKFIYKHKNMMLPETFSDILEVNTNENERNLRSSTRNTYRQS